MTDLDVIVIGGGPAGISAAVEAARSGLSVEVIEQRHSIGGAIHRQPIVGITPVPQASSAKARWADLSRDFAAARIPVRHGCVFLGIDGDGLLLVENRQTRHVETLRPRAVIVATGALETVLPRPGWDLAGVSTAGGLQVMMKETGRAPQGRVVLAGNGPLLLAVAAQMARLGNPPVAIIEAGDPVRRPLPALSLLRAPSLLGEAFGYLRTVLMRGLPWLRGGVVASITKTDDVLLLRVLDSRGRERIIEADRIGLHDGIRPNDFGLPPERLNSGNGPLILRAGDCREALGGVAAIADGRRAGRQIAALLSGKTHLASKAQSQIDAVRSVQATLSALFAPVRAISPFADLPDEMILCRCERRTVGDLRALCQQPDMLSAREVKLNGRFAMGACQGRFCAANTAALMATLNPNAPVPAVEDLTGRRWPVRPVSIAALVGTQSTPESE